MADNGIRTINLDLTTSAVPKEVLVHADIGGGVKALRRVTIEYFVQQLLGLAGLDPSVVADLSTRLTQEIEDRTDADASEAQIRSAAVDALTQQLTQFQNVQAGTSRVSSAIAALPDNLTVLRSTDATPALATNAIAGDFQAFAFAKTFSESGYVNTIRTRLAAPATTQNLRVTLYRAPGTGAVTDPSTLTKISEDYIVALPYLGGVTTAVSLDLPITSSPLPAGARVVCAIEGLNSANQPLALTFFVGNFAGSEDTFLHGFFKTANAWAPLSSGRVYGEFLTRAADIDLATDAQVSARMTAAERIVAGNRRSSVAGGLYANATYSAYAVGYAPNRRVNYPGTVTLWATRLAGRVASIVQTQIRRPIAIGDGGGRPGSNALDVTMGTRTLVVGTDLANPLSTFVQPVPFDVSSFGAHEAGYIYYFVYEGLSSVGAPVSFDGGTGRALGAVPSYAAGYIRDGTNWGALAANVPLAWSLTERIQVDQRTALAIGAQEPSTSGVAPVPPPVAGSFSPTMPRVVVQGPRGRIVVPSQALTFAAPSIATRTKSLTLSTVYDAYLDYADIEQVVVRRTSDNAVLAEGSDIKIDVGAGSITALTSAASVAVSATYVGKGQRYDLVFLDPTSGSIGTITGTERGVDALEYMPAKPAGMIPLFSVFVDWLGAKLIPLYEYRNRGRTGRGGDLAEWRMYCRERLSATFRALYGKYPFSIIGDGDSTTSQGSEFRTGLVTGGLPGGADYRGWGGARDMVNTVEPSTGVDYPLIPGYFKGRLPADTLAAIPTFNGDMGVNKHVRQGWNWRLLELFQSRYSSPCDYKNMAMSGTTAGDGMSGGVPNGRNPTRLNPMLAQAPGNLVSVGFGTNSLGQDDAYTDMVLYIKAVQAVGADVLVWAPPRIPQNSRAGTTEFWGTVHDQIVEAARFCDVAYVPSAMIFGQGAEGATGWDAKSLGICNGVNHPGPSELAAMARLGMQIFI